jgi:uncharacterized membrane-anchored protein YhcB (DUF1043 family)
VALVALYYQATRDLETQKATVASLQLELAKEVARAAELKSDLNTAHTDAQTPAAKSAQLSSVVESKEQALAGEKSKAESVQAALDQEKVFSSANRSMLFARNAMVLIAAALTSAGAVTASTGWCQPKKGAPRKNGPMAAYNIP